MGETDWTRVGRIVVFGLRGGEGVKKNGDLKKHAFSNMLFEPIFAENGPKKLPFWSPYGLQKRTLIAPKSMYKPMQPKILKKLVQTRLGIGKNEVFVP